MPEHWRVNPQTPKPCPPRFEAIRQAAPGTMGKRPRHPRRDAAVGPSGVPRRSGRDAKRRDAFPPHRRTGQR